MARLNWRFICLLLIGVGITLILQGEGADPRLVSATYGALAFGGLMFRLITTWLDTPVLVHALAMTLCGFLLLGAIGSMQLSGHGPGGLHHAAPIIAVSWPAAYLRLACIVIAIVWPAWVERRKSPFKV